MIVCVCNRLNETSCRDAARSGQCRDVACMYRVQGCRPRCGRCVPIMRDILSDATVARLEGLAGFRNVLVHEYAAVDLRRVHAGLDRLDDFDAFIADVDTWLARRPQRRG